MLENKGHMGKTIKFKSKEDYKFFLNDYNHPSLIQSIFSNWKYHGEYNTKNINFKNSIVQELLEKELVSENQFSKYNYQLEKLHLCLNSENKDLDESEQNNISISFYETSKTLKKNYVNFIKQEVSKLFEKKIHYQIVPTFRFHFPKQKGYNWNDRYHTDIMLGHPPFEFNIWMPFTKVYSSNSMRLTPYDDSVKIISSYNYDFELFAKDVQYNKSLIQHIRSKSKPLEMNYGEFVIFDPRCLHCTQYNDTKDTRISMDIRIILENEINNYSRKYVTTGRRKMPFLPGHYFSKESV
tara:strand:- start:2579 stop:3466 length:888 start_codon:yes stop_codon:yes gene_type:complete